MENDCPMELKQTKCTNENFTLSVEDFNIPLDSKK